MESGGFDQFKVGPRIFLGFGNVLVPACRETPLHVSSIVPITH
jgi:hypothetical protein